jgi:hypothetical protein
MKIKYFLKSTKEMFLFKNVTYYDRWFEISLGMMSWFCIIIILYGIFKSICSH